MRRDTLTAYALLTLVLVMLAFQLGRWYGDYKGFDRGWNAGYIRGLENQPECDEVQP